MAKGKTFRGLLRANINKMTEKSITTWTRIAREMVRKTVARWEKREYKSPAYYELSRQTGGTMKISFKGKTLQQKKAELAKAIHFLKDDTRTVAGWEKVKKRNVKALNKKFREEGSDTRLTPEDYDRLYSAYNKAKQIDKNIETMEYKYKVMDMLVQEIQDPANAAKSVDELAVEMAEKFREIYEENERQHNQNMDDISEEI